MKSVRIVNYIKQNIAGTTAMHGYSVHDTIWVAKTGKLNIPREAFVEHFIR
ncbi:MAG: hypothetical protein IKD90_07715 [Clostridiales bacterium]|nr:hypothetical protein [Clostridiales bacterium]